MILQKWYRFLGENVFFLLNLFFHEINKSHVLKKYRLGDKEILTSENQCSESSHNLSSIRGGSFSRSSQRPYISIYT